MHRPPISADTSILDVGIRPFLLPALSGYLPWLALAIPFVVTLIGWRFSIGSISRSGATYPSSIVFSAVVLGLLFFAMTGLVTAWWLAKQRELEQLAESLEQNEERHRSVLNDVREVIFQLNPQGAWSLLNSAWTQLSGYPVDSTLGKGFLVYFHPDDRDKCQAALSAIAAGGMEHHERNVELVRQNGLG